MTTAASDFHYSFHPEQQRAEAPGRKNSISRGANNKETKLTPTAYVHALLLGLTEGVCVQYIRPPNWVKILVWKHQWWYSNKTSVTNSNSYSARMMTWPKNAFHARCRASVAVKKSRVSLEIISSPSP